MAKLLHHLDDYLLDQKHDDLFLVSVMRIKLTLKENLEELGWLKLSHCTLSVTASWV